MTMAHALAAWTFALAHGLTAVVTSVGAEPAGETAAPVAPALTTPAESAAPIAPALLSDLDQLARCNPFRPIGLAGKSAAGEATGSSEKGAEGAEGSASGTGKTPAPPAPDALTLLKKSLIVSAIVSTEREIYAVIGGKRYYVGDEVAPKIRISKITVSGITIAPAENPQP
jgi:hypothetical protein